MPDLPPINASLLAPDYTAYDYDVLAIRRRLGRDRWGVPQPGPGTTGVHFRRSDGKRSLMITSSTIPSDESESIWLHASIAVQPNGTEVPDYYELKHLHHAVWGGRGWAVQVFAPADAHVNIRANALHLWGRLDGQRFHPDFGWAGSI